LIGASRREEKKYMRREESPIPPDPILARSGESPIPSDPITAGSRARTRYYAEFVRVNPEEVPGQVQAVLDEKEAEEWHLVGVAGGLPKGGMILFWDTQRPSFGRAKWGRSSERSSTA
jgi:hypothetical protein